MTHTLIAPATTMDEVDAAVTSLYYMQRVNFEAADEIADRARPLWQQVSKHRISEVAETPDSRIATSTLYNRKWDASGSVFDRTRALAPFLMPDMWPEFYYDGEDAAKKNQINVWTELIGLSPEAVDANQAIQETRQELASQLGIGERLAYRQAQEMRGWYVTIGTSRRTTQGWVVGGRGLSIQVMQDPLARLIRIDRNSGYSIKWTDKRVAQHLAATEWAMPTEAEKYNLKTAKVSLIFPPDMAAERKEWVQGTLPKANAARAEALPIHATFMEWKQKANPLLARDQVYQNWMKGMPPSIEDWTKDTGQLRWIHGATETMAVLYSIAAAAGMSDMTLREAVLDEYRRRHPENLLSDAEKAVIAAKPAGDEDLSTVVQGVLVDTFSGLAPLF